MADYPTQPGPPPEWTPLPSGPLPRPTQPLSHPLQPPTAPWRPPSQPISAYSQPFYPPGPPPKRRTNTLLIAAIIIIAFMVAIGLTAGIAYRAGYNSYVPLPYPTQLVPSPGITIVVETPTSPPGSPTPTPKPAPGWQDIQSFSGVGNQQAPTFSVPKTWRMLWTCDASGSQFILGVDIHNADTSYYAVGAIFTTCTVDNASGMTTEHKAGNVYLDITGDGSWTIEVQVFK